MNPGGRPDSRRLHAWPAEAGTDRFAVIEQDIRELLSTVAASRRALHTQERDHDARVRRLMLELLEVLDAFDRVLAVVGSKQDLVTPQMKIWLGNFRTISRLLEGVLADQGVTAFESIGAPFDPLRHRAADTSDDRAHPVDSVVEEHKRGYTWNDALLRKAYVVVAVRGEASRGEDDGAGQDQR